MKRSSLFDDSSFARKAVLLGALAVALHACSAGSPRAAFDTTETDPTDPHDPESPAPPATGSDAPADGAPDPEAAPPGECARAAPSNACGVSPQCGCAPRETCDVVDSSGNAKCVTAGSAPMGHPCTATAGCAVGLTCIFGICHAFCGDPSKPCTQPKTGACAQIRTTDGPDVPNLAICRIACAPHDAASCGGTTSAGTGVCRVDDQGNTECHAGGARRDGETCSPSDECGPGLICTTSTSGSTCKRWCRVGQSDCGAGKACSAFASEINVRGVVYGHCP
ncbi:MAG: hypothetical protein KF894_22270 [Labilithrix sp.]|nr:hypothetical protein [Labilithrix sp.]